MSLRLALACGLLVGCAIDESGLAADAGADASIDVQPKDVTVLDITQPDATGDAIDEPPPPCNPIAAFGNFVDLPGGVNTTGAYDGSPFLTSDELTIFFARDAGNNRLALFYATRAATSQPFAAAKKIGSISTNQTYDTAPFVDDALKQLYFSSVRDGNGHYHLYRATGDGSPDGWSAIAPLSALNWYEPAADLQMWVAQKTNEIWFASDRLGSLDLYTSPDTSTAPTYQTGLATSYAEVHPLLSGDALTLFFGRSDGNVVHVYAATRANVAMPFVNPQIVGDFDFGNSNNTPGWLSPDGCRMYFTSDRGGDADVWMATRGQ